MGSSVLLGFSGASLAGGCGSGRAFGIKDIMKPLRIIHVLFVLLALVPLLLIAATLVLSPIQKPPPGRHG